MGEQGGRSLPSDVPFSGIVCSWPLLLAEGLLQGGQQVGARFQKAVPG